MGRVSTPRSGASGSRLPGSASSKPAMRAGPSDPAASASLRRRTGGQTQPAVRLWGAPGSLEPRGSDRGPLLQRASTTGASKVLLTLQRVSLAHGLQGGGGKVARRPGSIHFWDVHV